MGTYLLSANFDSRIETESLTLTTIPWTDKNAKKEKNKARIRPVEKSLTSLLALSSFIDEDKLEIIEITKEEEKRDGMNNRPVHYANF
jgi:hypothetical protein